MEIYSARVSNAESIIPDETCRIPREKQPIVTVLRLVFSCKSSCHFITFQVNNTCILCFDEVYCYRQKNCTYRETAF
jgi:hypothetical protein